MIYVCNFLHQFFLQMVPLEYVNALMVAHHYSKDVLSKGEGCGKKNFYSRSEKKLREHERFLSKNVIVDWKKVGRVPYHAAVSLRDSAENDVIRWLEKELSLEVPNYADVIVETKFVRTVISASTSTTSTGFRYVLPRPPLPEPPVSSLVDEEPPSRPSVVDDERPSSPSVPETLYDAPVPASSCSLDSEFNVNLLLRPVDDEESEKDFVSIYDGMHELPIHGHEVLVNWMIDNNVTTAAADDLMKKLSRASDFDLKTLPLCGKTIKRRIAELESTLEKYTVRRMQTQEEEAVDVLEATTSNGATEDRVKIQQIISSTEKKKNKIPDGQYVHLGLHDALLGDSPGLYHWARYIALLRRLEAYRPGILPQRFLELAYKDELPAAKRLAESCSPMLPGYFWYRPELKRPPMLLFSLQLHVDGVEVYENSEKATATPILASVYEVVPFFPEDGCVDYTRGEARTNLVLMLEGMICFAG